MSPRTAHTIVLLAGGLMFAAIGLRRDTIPDPFRFAWAAGLITLFLSVLADISPEIAGPAAGLVLLVIYTRNRDVIGGVLPSTKNTKTTGVSSSVAVSTGTDAGGR